MATRALIGYLDDSKKLTTTYNHYDGYPAYLGKILKEHYSGDEKAKSIASKGYISSIIVFADSLNLELIVPSSSILVI